jgi:hypothetical protein
MSNTGSPAVQTVKEFVFERKMSEDEAFALARKKNDWFWNIVFGHLPLTEMRLMWLEFLLVEIDTDIQPNFIDRMRGREPKNRRKTIEILADGTTGQVALVKDKPRILVKEFEEDSERVQRTEIPEDDLLLSAKKLAIKVTHRLMGGIPIVEVREYRSVFRPYYVAFYGQMQTGNKVRYVPIAADGGKNKRVR